MKVVDKIKMVHKWIDWSEITDTLLLANNKRKFISIFQKRIIDLFDQFGNPKNVDKKDLEEIAFNLFSYLNCASNGDHDFLKKLMKSTKMPMKAKILDGDDVASVKKEVRKNLSYILSTNVGAKNEPLNAIFELILNPSRNTKAECLNYAGLVAIFLSDIFHTLGCLKEWRFSLGWAYRRRGDL